MALPAMRAFVHRLNPNGSVDSICKHCFATVAHSETEDRLEEHELHHVCSLESLAIQEAALRKAEMTREGTTRGSGQTKGKLD